MWREQRRWRRKRNPSGPLCLQHFTDVCLCGQINSFPHFIPKKKSYTVWVIYRAVLVLVSVSLCTPRKESIHRASLIHNIADRWKWVVTLRSGRFTSRKEQRYPLNRRPEQFGTLWSTEKFLFLTGIRNPDHPSCSLITIMTELSWRRDTS